MENLDNELQSQKLQPEQPPVPAGTGADSTTPPAPGKKSRRNVLIIIAALLVCLCCISAGVGIDAIIGEVTTETPKVENVIDAYMRAMAGQEAEKAYSLFSTRAKRYVPLSDVEKLLVGNNYKLFEGYQSLAVTDININLTSDPNPDMPQGEVAEVQGMVSYDGGFTGDFYAVLEKEGDEWRLDAIHVTAPADKFGP